MKTQYNDKFNSNVINLDDYITPPQSYCHEIEYQDGKKSSLIDDLLIYQ